MSDVKPVKKAKRVAHTVDALPVGNTYRAPKAAIGKPGAAPKGVETDKRGSQAKAVAVPKVKRGTEDLKERREIRVMLGAKVPFPRLGDRRALLAPKATGRKTRVFAVVEYAGNVCVRVHGATDDYAQAGTMAVNAARTVKAWLNREIIATAKRQAETAVRNGGVGRTVGAGALVGKGIDVKVTDRTGLFPKPKPKPKAVDLTRKGGKITRRKLSDDELIQRQHGIDARGNRECRHCGKRGDIANLACEAVATKNVSPGLASLRSELSELDVQHAKDMEALREAERQAKEAAKAAYEASKAAEAAE